MHECETHMVDIVQINFFPFGVLNGPMFLENLLGFSTFSVSNYVTGTIKRCFVVENSVNEANH